MGIGEGEVVVGWKCCYQPLPDNVVLREEVSSDRIVGNAVTGMESMERWLFRRGRINLVARRVL